MNSYLLYWTFIVHHVRRHEFGNYIVKCESYQRLVLWGVLGPRLLAVGWIDGGVPGKREPESCEGLTIVSWQGQFLWSEENIPCMESATSHSKSVEFSRYS